MGEAAWQDAFESTVETEYRNAKGRKISKKVMDSFKCLECSFLLKLCCRVARVRYVAPRIVLSSRLCPFFSPGIGCSCASPHCSV